jgi:hypothetical protein
MNYLLGLALILSVLGPKVARITGMSLAELSQRAR